MKKIKTTEWNLLDRLDDEKNIAGYLEAAIEENDYAYFIKALGNAARAHGINEVAKIIGVGRESLYKSLSGKSKPNFDTVYKAINALGFKISITPKNKPDCKIT